MHKLEQLLWQCRQSDQLEHHVHIQYASDVLYLPLACLLFAFVIPTALQCSSARGCITSLCSARLLTGMQT